MGSDRSFRVSNVERDDPDRAGCHRRQGLEGRGQEGDFRVQQTWRGSAHLYRNHFCLSEQSGGFGVTSLKRMKSQVRGRGRKLGEG